MSKEQGRFLISDDGESYLPVAKVTNVTPLKKTREAKSDNDLDNTRDGWNHYRGGLKDGGTVSITIKYRNDDPNHQKLNAHFDDPEPKHYACQYPDEGKTEIQYKGLITEVDTPMPEPDGIHFLRTFTLQIDGEPKEGKWSDS